MTILKHTPLGTIKLSKKIALRKIKANTAYADFSNKELLEEYCDTADGKYVFKTKYSHFYA